MRLGKSHFPRAPLVASLTLGAVLLRCGTEFHACQGDDCPPNGSADSTGSSSGEVTSTASGGATSTASSGTGGTSGAAGGGASGTSSDGGTGGGSESTTGEAGSAGAAGGGPGCDDDASPFEDACVVTEDYGVFVSPLGSDETGEGTRESPYATLGHAVEVAASGTKRVYACASEGVFEESLMLNTVSDGLELFGALDCESWTANASLRAQVMAEDGSALVIDGVRDGVTIEYFHFEAPDAELPGHSSVAAFMQDSENVTMRQVTLVAGEGAAGMDGDTVEVGYPNKAELDGNDGTTTAPGAKVIVECAAGGKTEGGAGGTVDPTGGGPGTPDHDGPGGEAGVVGSPCTGVGGLGGGGNGADAPMSPPGPGAASHGVLTEAGWQPSDGEPGSAGLPGQGGGGGAGDSTGGGGGGGAGGCGGAGGGHGQGGGASIALLLLNAPITLIDSELITHSAGGGGAGDAGQQGQQEFGSAGVQEADGCAAGRGGLGGSGGSGGGGAGGISVGLVIQGDAPTVENTSITPGNAGDGGVGGDAGVNDGVEGISETELSLE